MTLKLLIVVLLIAFFLEESSAWKSLTPLTSRIAYRCAGVCVSLAFLINGPDVSIAVSGGGRDYATKDIRGLDFSNKDLSNKDFTQCDATGTNFKNSVLKGSRFYRARLDDADFSKV